MSLLAWWNLWLSMMVYSFVLRCHDMCLWVPGPSKTRVHPLKTNHDQLTLWMHAFQKKWICSFDIPKWARCSFFFFNLDKINFKWKIHFISKFYIEMFASCCDFKSIVLLDLIWNIKYCLFWLVCFSSLKDILIDYNWDLVTILIF